MKQKLLGIMAISILSVSLATFAYANQPIKLLVNDHLLETDVAPQMVQGRVLVPIRAISQALGVDINWDSDSGSVLIDNSPNKSDNLQILQLEQALTAKDPLTAAKTWAEGVKTRNGAMQYAVMSPELRKEKYEEFSQANWCPGVSSPWVDSYEITQKEAEGNTYYYDITFTYTDSTHSTFYERNIITVTKSDNNWVISHTSPQA